MVVTPEPRPHLTLLSQCGELTDIRGQSYQLVLLFPNWRLVQEGAGNPTLINER